MAAFSKKKYLLVSTLSTSLSILLLLLKLNLVNLYKTVNQKYSTCAWGLEPATLLKKRLWHRCFPVNFVKFLRTPFLRTPLDDCFWNVRSTVFFSQVCNVLNFFFTPPANIWQPKVFCYCQGVNIGFFLSHYKVRELNKLSRVFVELEHGCASSITA